jgi:hypothetical protein
MRRPLLNQEEAVEIVKRCPITQYRAIVETHMTTPAA